MKKSKKIIFASLMILPLIVWAVIMITSTKSYTVFPFNTPYSEIKAFADESWGGSSSIDAFSGTGDSIDLMYTLRRSEKNDTALAVISITLDRLKKEVDLSRYASLSLHFKKVTRDRVTVSLQTILPGVTTHKPGSYRPNIRRLKLSPTRKDYVIPLKELHTSGWWWGEQNEINKEQLPPEDFKRVTELKFNLVNTGRLSPGGEERGIFSIGKIILHPPPSPLIPAVSWLLLPWYAGLGLLYRLRKKTAPKIPMGKTVEALSYEDQDLKRIMEYLKSNYMIPDMSTKKIDDFLGISVRRTRMLLKKQFDTTFTRLINKIRIAEAKRCLLETDLKILDIALKVGFGDSSYFNKLFKQKEGLTPSDFRKREKGANV